MTASTVLERLEFMFLRGEDAPVASDKTDIIYEQNLGLVKLVCEVVQKPGKFWINNKEVIKRRCSPVRIDEQEVIGYVLADLLGRPLLAGTGARCVGTNAYNALRKVNKELKNAVNAKAAAVRLEKKQPCKLEAAEAKGDAAIAAVLAAACDLKFPNETVAPTAKRKREVIPFLSLLGPDADEYPDVPNPFDEFNLSISELKQIEKKAQRAKVCVLPSLRPA